VAVAGRRVSEQVRQIDILPTILDLVGLGDELPSTAAGRSLRPLMDGKALPPVPAFIETCQNSREPSSFYGVRHGGFKYAFDAGNPRVPEELYDLEADPEETKNLAAAMPGKAAELRALILEHLDQAGSAAVAMDEEMSDKELAGLAEHLRKLGYVE
jgi:arylsulfatase A-like enzyme